MDKLKVCPQCGRDLPKSQIDANGYCEDCNKKYGLKYRQKRKRAEMPWYNDFTVK